MNKQITNQERFLYHTHVYAILRKSKNQQTLHKQSNLKTCKQFLQRINDDILYH